MVGYISAVVHLRSLLDRGMEASPGGELRLQVTLRFRAFYFPAVYHDDDVF